MSTTTSSTSVFSGNSRYAADFQSVIDRATAIASLPISQLNDQKTGLNDQSTALGALDEKFTSLETAVANIGTALGSGSYEASVTGGQVVSASLGSGAMEGSYSIEVTSLGAYSTSMSSGTPKVANPGKSSITTAASVTLKVGTAQAVTITPAEKTLSSLASAINAAGAGVRATIVNVSSASDPDYRLSLQSTRLGPISISLKAGTTDLVETQTTGSLASYKVNGVATEAESDSRTVTIAPGLTFQLLEESEEGVDSYITVTRQSSALASALSSFATAYNDAVDELDKHRGDSGGALSGREIVYSLSATLRQLGRYAGSGAVSSLEQLGLTFDQTGQLSFDQFTLMASDFTDSSSVSAFLTGATGTGGFVKSATNLLDSIERPVSGSLKAEITSVKNEISRTDDLITTNQERVNDLQTSLQGQMAAADAAIAQLEQQYSFISSMFESMQTSSYNQS